MESLQGPFCPAPFCVVAIDGDDYVIGKPMIVHALVRPLCRFAAYRVKSPINLVQIDICRQRTKRTSLRNSGLSSGLDDLFDEMQDLGVLDSRRDFL